MIGGEQLTVAWQWRQFHIYMYMCMYMYMYIHVYMYMYISLQLIRNASFGANVYAILKQSAMDNIFCLQVPVIMSCSHFFNL